MIRPASLAAARSRPRPARRRVPASLALMVAAAVLIAATHGDGDQAVGRAAPDLPSAVVAATTTVAPAPVPEPAPTGIAFAEVDGVELVLPAAATVAHGFHEAGGGGPLPLTPVGMLQPGEDTNGFDEADALVDTDGPHYLVMPTRNRGTAPTGAVDVVLEPGEDVLAPVDGVVTKVADFALYGRYQDTLVHIRPDGAPHLEVKILHIEGVVVGEGDAVVAGQTVVAGTARRIPVRNQIDRFVGQAWPHVHLEVVPAPANT
ncbi:MAG: hypothetical protein KG028_08460 [Actinobacteria bacterium]|nr:hypothetical protein [Actinomycetota bacterium]